VAMKRQWGDQVSQRLVQHNYHDHSNDKPPEHISKKGIVGSGYCFTVSKTGLGAAGLSFPIKLHEMLNSVEEEGLSHIVSWQPHGRCFIIRKSEEFEKQLLERFFGVTKKSSFQRQLNMYGFKRITQGNDAGSYYHELFLRGKVFLAYQIRRTRIKGEGARAKANPTQEPNFWAMRWLPDRDAPLSVGEEAAGINQEGSVLGAHRSSQSTASIHRASQVWNRNVSFSYPTLYEAPVDDELTIVTPPRLDRSSSIQEEMWGRLFVPVGKVSYGEDSTFDRRPGIFGKMQIPFHKPCSHALEHTQKVQNSSSWSTEGVWTREAPELSNDGFFEGRIHPGGLLATRARKVTMGSVSEEERALHPSTERNTQELAILDDTNDIPVTFLPQPLDDF